jgi:hypothetical protein
MFRLAALRCLGDDRAVFCKMIIPKAMFDRPNRCLRAICNVRFLTQSGHGWRIRCTIRPTQPEPLVHSLTK